MTKIKIISNPYEKLIQYFIYDASEDEWIDIAKNNGYTGKLKADKLIHGFFPFVVEEIMKVIIDEYEDTKGKIQIIFEGTTDEYKQLSAVCSSEEIASSIELQPLTRCLNNAYDVLPKVVDVFDQNVRPIVKSSVDDGYMSEDLVEDDLNRYTDASNDIVPICVIGNYSAGKSTFINGLIGQEILPSGDKAVTARVFKIYQVKNDESAEVVFTFDHKEITLTLTGDQFAFSRTDDFKIIKILTKELSEITDHGYAVRINKALAVINDYESDDHDSIGSVVEIHIPFHKGLWDQFPGKYVILDTPGSNAASRVDHREVLSDAMRGMSNGIPVFVSEFDSLDSTDNEALYDVVKETEGLDSRFAMIIVNKSDAANLPKEDFSKEEKDDILHETIPKHLYSSGIYFVSSIMGLGSKNDGHFIDEHCDETYELYKNRYIDENDRHYKQLYKYDILPDQIKPSMMKNAQEVSQSDPMFVNSGFYSVENAIQTFSLKYASYNKCQQSELFLNKVINSTQDELEKAMNHREEIKKSLESKLEKDKQEMIANVEKTADEQAANYEANYAESIKDVIQEAKKYYTVDELKQQEAQFTAERQKDIDIEEKKADAKKQAADVGDAVKGGFSKLKSNFSLHTVKEFGSSVIKETKEAIDSKSALMNSTREVDRAAAKDLIDASNHHFKEQVEQAEKDIDEKSREYWTQCSGKFKDQLAEVVKNSTLSEKKKMELTEMIVEYKPLEFEKVENGEIFKIDEFDYLLNFGDLKLFKMDKLFLNRLSAAYKNRVASIIDDIDASIHTAFLNSFNTWQENLVNIVRTNIVDYSPELKEQQTKINKETERIHDLQSRENHLKIYAGDIQSMTEWQEG